jgi:hypothetical protein
MASVSSCEKTRQLQRRQPERSVRLFSLKKFIDAINNYLGLAMCDPPGEKEPEEWEGLNVF